MLREIRSRLTYANVVATAAMFIALGGGAYALSGVPDGQGVFHGCVNSRTGALRVLPTGAACSKAGGRGKHRRPGEFAISWNQRGQPGQPGQNGQNGSVGPPGPFPATLPSGATLRGAFNIDDVSASGSQFAHEGISFGFTLASKPSEQVVPMGGPSTAQCPGSAASPTAAPGFMCVYAVTTSNLAATNGLGVEDPDGNMAGVVGTTGADLFVKSAVGGRFYAGGTWAVTAP